MIKDQTIDYAIAETLKKHPSYAGNFSTTIYHNIISGIHLENFTSNNNARSSIRGLTQNELLRYILNQAVSTYSAIIELYPSVVNHSRIGYHDLASLNKHFTEWQIIREEVEKMQNCQSNLFNEYILNPKRLFSLINAVLKIRYNPKFYPLTNNSEILFDNIMYGNQFRKKIDNLSNRNYTLDELYYRIRKDYQEVSNIEEVHVNYEALNNCLQQVLDGSQIKYKHNEYALDGNLFATQDIGKKRRNQEDSTLIMTHPQNNSFKLLAVADGMGGEEYGEKASNYTLMALSKWFQSLPLLYYENHDILYHQLKQIVRQISAEVANKFGSKNHISGTTLVCAIVGRNVTTIVNVGDSRAYAYKNGELNLITKDQSLVWNEMEYRNQKNKRSITYDDINNLRFAPGNNQILSAVGSQNVNPQIWLIGNNAYDKLFLFSDGVHDLLSTDDINFIAETTPPDRITHEIVKKAINNNAIGYDEYGNRIIIEAGKDNASAAAYIRR